MNRIINISVIPGEKLDGSGKVCIHLFIPDQSGPFAVHHVLQVVTEGDQQVITASHGRGRLACDPRRNASPVVLGKVTTATLHTDDPRAVTCPKCKTTKEYADILFKIRSVKK